MQTSWPISPIRFKSSLNLLLAASQRVEKKPEAEKGDIALSKLPYATFSEKRLLEVDSLSIKEENNRKNNDKDKKKSHLFGWMDSSNTSYVIKSSSEFL